MAVRNEACEGVTVRFWTGRGSVCRLDRQLGRCFPPPCHQSLHARLVGLFDIDVRWRVQRLAFPYKQCEENEADPGDDRGDNGAGNDPFVGQHRVAICHRSQDMVQLGASKLQSLDNNFTIGRAHLENWFVGKKVGEVVDEGEGIKEGDRIDEAEVGRGMDSVNALLLIRET